MNSTWEYIDNRLVVDEAFFGGPGCKRIYVVVGRQVYLAAPWYATIDPQKLSPLPAAPPGERIPFPGYDYFVWGLYPRDYSRFISPLGRAITAEELDSLRQELCLTEEDVSGEFIQTARGCLGAPDELSRSYKAIQIRPPRENAIPLETRLRDAGIEAFSGSPGRLTIRVE